MIWALSIITVLVIGWYVYEGRWDRQLFQSEAGRVCVNVRPHGAMEFLEAHPETQVLDVRSEAEFRRGALPGAVCISFGDPAFSSKLSELNASRPVLVYCAGGFRSRKAVAILKTQGFVHILNLHRGYHSWRLSNINKSHP